VTGAGRGIGRAHALALARLGAAVVVNDIGARLDGTGRDESVAAVVADEITGSGGLASADTTDIASVAGGRSAVGTVLERYGRIDILVNNAGFATGGGTVETPEESGLDALLAVHLLGALGTMSAAFPDMQGRRWGRIINTVSEVALDGRFAGSLGYGAAKAALWSATLTAAVEGAPHGITVNAVSPGARTRLNEELLDAGFRVGTSAALDLDPHYVANVVGYMVSETAADVTGRIVHVAGPEIREYSTRRTSRSPLVQRIEEALQTDALEMPGSTAPPPPR
jgi:NAD(P)-dependent dehydrogenase (short-subunit alcohol dehydrogenase family)